MPRPPRLRRAALGQTLRDRRGVTLLEVLVALAVMGLLLTPVLLILTQGTRTDATARRQFGRQEKAYRVLQEVVDGWRDGGEPVPGLRQARDVLATAPGPAGRLSYRLPSEDAVSYCADGAAKALYRYRAPVCPPTNSGTPILTGVTDFGASQSDNIVSLVLEVGGTEPGTVGDARVRLVTKVTPRNRP